MKVVSVLNIFIVDNAQFANIWKFFQYWIYLSWTMHSALTYESCLSIEYIDRGTVPSALTLNFETICIVLYPESPQSDVYLSRNRVQWCTGNTISYEVFPLGIYFVKTIEIRSIQNKKRKLIVQKCCCLLRISSSSLSCIWIAPLFIHWITIECILALTCNEVIQMHAQ